MIGISIAVAVPCNRSRCCDMIPARSTVTHASASGYGLCTISRAVSPTS
ncbi:MAG: hypothetical protein H6705_14465 [Myxococcales bacterium]|nr:hypothetical protein [Myxococcales bacterium]